MAQSWPKLGAGREVQRKSKSSAKRRKSGIRGDKQNRQPAQERGDKRGQRGAGAPPSSNDATTAIIAVRTAAASSLFFHQRSTKNFRRCRKVCWLAPHVNGDARRKQPAANFNAAPRAANLYTTTTGFNLVKRDDVPIDAPPSPATRRARPPADRCAWAAFARER